MSSISFFVVLKINGSMQKMKHKRDTFCLKKKKKVPTWNIYGNDFLRILNVPKSKEKFTVPSKTKACHPFWQSRCPRSYDFTQ